MYRDIRLAKLKEWEIIQTKYPDKFKKTHKSCEIKDLEAGEVDIALAGRLMLFRKIGKIAFGQVKDFYGTFQIVLKQDVLEDLFSFFEKNLDIGDIIGVTGEVFITKTGEKSLLVKSLKLLSKCLLPLPEKWNGLVDEEQKLRKRYLDLIVNDESMQKFKLRNGIISTIRRYLEEQEFIEVETPILQTQASGALATPFKTHHKALDIPLFLRIAPETYLKRLIVGGYDRVFEIGKSFRNEGVDSSHLQEFTMLEFYATCWNFEDAIKFVENIFVNLFEKLNLNDEITYQNQKINFSFPWKRITYKNLIYKYTKLDLEELLKDEEKFIYEASKFIDVSEYNSLASMIDGLYKKCCRPNLIDPCIIINQPSVLGPLARVNDENSLWSDRFQIVINGLEVVNAYSELVDPIAQRIALENQRDLSAKGEEEAMEMEEDFLHAMEYGMMPMAGVGIGIDRIVSLLTDSKSLREVVFFPSLK